MAGQAGTDMPDFLGGRDAVSLLFFARACFAPTNPKGIRSIACETFAPNQSQGLKAGFHASNGVNDSIVATVVGLNRKII